MTRATREPAVPAPDEPVDARAALAQAISLERLAAQAIHVLRAFVEAENGLRGAAQRERELTARSEDLERELPALDARVRRAREQVAQAEQLVRDAHAGATTAVQQELADAQVALAAARQAGDAKTRELEATYQARQAQLAHETGEAEARLARVQEELAAVVARHTRP
jgi:chromosome segregation ATPase